MNLIYLCVFHQENYINLLKLLLNSLITNGKLNKNTTNILIITSPNFLEKIKSTLLDLDILPEYYLLNLNTLFEAGCARLNIFNYPNIQNYQKILYLDTDILINNNINTIFDLDILQDKLYTLEEGTIGEQYWGAQFFDFTKYNRKLTAFTSGILYFYNNNSIIELFTDITNHINDFKKKKKPIPICLDQPFIVYHAISKNKYDNQLLKSFAENNPINKELAKIIYHFPGGPGNYASKYDKITEFLTKDLDKIKLDI